MSEAVKTLIYRFRLKDGRKREFSLHLKKSNLRLEVTPRKNLPDWTKLEFHQCPNCPLKPADSPRCPVAVSLVDLMDLFKDCLSTEMAKVTVISEDREYRKTMAVHNGLSSLMGLYMATSGCPVLDKLRPMVYTHLPFSNLQETIYRSLSMYLIAQFLSARRGKKPDWDLKDLMSLYEEVNQVNRTFFKRLLSVTPQDASLNALVKLDCLAGFARFSIGKNYFKKLEEMFEPYLEK